MKTITIELPLNSSTAKNGKMYAEVPADKAVEPIEKGDIVEFRVFWEAAPASRKQRKKGIETIPAHYTVNKVKADGKGQVFEDQDGDKRVRIYIVEEIGFEQEFVD